MAQQTPSTSTTESSRSPDTRWLTPGVWGVGFTSFLADVGHKVPTSLFASFVTSTLGASGAALGLILLLYHIIPFLPTTHSQ